MELNQIVNINYLYKKKKHKLQNKIINFIRIFEFVLDLRDLDITFITFTRARKNYKI
jgi:hypothetical protein